jgi:DNA polymerase III subunit delta'
VFGRPRRAAVLRARCAREAREAVTKRAASRLSASPNRVAAAALNVNGFRPCAGRAHTYVVSIVPLHGHDAVRARLLESVGRATLPASMLLHGPRGVGKQRLALWLAQLLLCGEATAPCGACQGCRYVGSLTHPDLHWYFPRPRLKDADASPADVQEDYADAIAERAKAGGLYATPSGTEGIYVSTVRSLVQQASMRPAVARRKVFVIGDAERMVPQEGADAAANAFLKLLEEPPPTSTFILTSSESGALLPTIKSRVVCVRVAPVAEHDVRAWLAEPLVRARLDGERVAAGDDARVRLAAGAPGRLLSDSGQAGAVAEAKRLLEAATAGTSAVRLRLAFAQGAAKARGAFTDVLDALTVLLHDRVRAAVERGDGPHALGAARAMDCVERAKQHAAGNVSPSLVSARLLNELTAALR